MFPVIVCFISVLNGDRSIGNVIVTSPSKPQERTRDNGLSCAVARGRLSRIFLGRCGREETTGADFDVALRAGLLAKLKPRGGLHPPGGHPGRAGQRRAERVRVLAVLRQRVEGRQAIGISLPRQVWAVKPQLCDSVHRPGRTNLGLRREGRGPPSPPARKAS